MIAHYRLILALHIIGIITWMAGILYLFRLFVYHAAETESVVKARFVVMEEKLYRIITFPGMVFSVLMGGTLIFFQPSLLEEGWLRLKLSFAILLVISTLWAGKIKKDLENGTCRISSKTFRFLNELPTLLMIGIVLLVILRPF